MQQFLKLAAFGGLMALASAAQAGPIGIGDFTSPTIVGFGGPDPTSLVPAPLSIGPATFTDANSASVVWWGPSNSFLDCVGGCVTTDTFGVGSLDVAIAPGYSLVGLYVGQATPYSLDVSFFDSSNTLLGTVVAAGAGDGVTFAGWENVGGTIASIKIANGVANGFRIAAQSGYFEAAGTVPEPASWAMMIGGFALAGTALRRRKVGALTLRHI